MEAKQSQLSAIFEALGTCLAICATVFLLCLFVMSGADPHNVDPDPGLARVSVESVSMTVVNITTDSQVKANLEVVFNPIENTNVNNTIAYNHINASAFRWKKLGMTPSYDYPRPIYADATLLDKVRVAPLTFQQRGGDKKTLVVQMNDVIVDVDEYEQHIRGRYGVLYLTLNLEADAEMKDGKGRKFRFNTRVECFKDVLKVDFPVELPWNQTKQLSFKPPNSCSVVMDGWRVTKMRLASEPIKLATKPVKLVVSDY